MRRELKDLRSTSTKMRARSILDEDTKVSNFVSRILSLSLFPLSLLSSRALSLNLLRSILDEDTEIS
jgi:hypothetical protein